MKHPLYRHPYRGGVPRPFEVSHPIPTRILRRYGTPADLYEFAHQIDQALRRDWNSRPYPPVGFEAAFLHAMETTMRRIHELLQSLDYSYYERMNILIGNRGWIDWGETVHVTNYVDEIDVYCEDDQPRRGGGYLMYEYANSGSGRGRDRHNDRDGHGNGRRDRKSRHSSGHGRRDHSRDRSRDRSRHGHQDSSRDRSRDRNRDSSRDRPRHRNRSSSRQLKRSRSRDANHRSLYRHDRSRSMDGKSRAGRHGKDDDRNRDHDRDNRSSRSSGYHRSPIPKKDSSHHGSRRSSPRPSTPPQRSSSQDRDIFATTSTKSGKQRARTPPPEKPTKFDPYKVFNEPCNASAENLKNTYRRLMTEHHPDRQMTKAEEEKENASNKAADINRAWAILGNPEKRAVYDKYGCTDDYTINEHLIKNRERGERENISSWALARHNAESDNDEMSTNQSGESGKFKDKSGTNWRQSSKKKKR